MRITFSLAKPQRIRLTVRGPAPSCRAAGTMAIRGVRGVNRFDFRGRIRRQTVRAGVYHLTLTRGSSRLRVARPLLVQVVSPRRTILLGEARAPRSLCDASPALAGDDRLAAVSPGTVMAFDPPPVQGTSSPAAPAAAPEPQKVVPEPEPNEVLGVEVDLPSVPRPGDGGPWAFAGALLLVGLPLLVMLALVVRFLRGSWNPS